MEIKSVYSGVAGVRGKKTNSTPKKGIGIL
jgi:hypothetical protein